MIRKVKYDDIEDITNIILSFLRDKQIDIDENREREIIKALNILLDSGNNLYVGVDSNDRVKAYVNFHLCHFPLIGGKEYYISELFVEKNSRGKSYGSDLLDYVINRAKLDGCKRILLNNAKTSESFERSFYAKHGFQARDFMANFIMNL